MKALVTGGAGFIGSHLCERLLKDGWRVVCLDNLSTGKIKNIKHLMKKRRFQFIHGDVRDAVALDVALADVDVVFNQMAAKKTICENSPVEDCHVNAGGTLNLLLAMHRNGVKRIVHASTGSVYGECQHRITEFTPLDPVSYYGVSKMAGEKYVAAFGDMFGFEYTILRYFHVYGARQDSSSYGGVVPIFIRQALENSSLTIHGDGEQVRSFTYVDDVVDANIYGATYMDNAIYNCASGIQVTINELAQAVQDNILEVGVTHGDVMLGDVRNFDIDNMMIKADYPINFTTFEDGLKLTIEYYVKQ